MEFAKLQGSGNDFIVIDNRDGKVDKLIEKIGISIKDFVVGLCAFHTGIGADGLILIEDPENKENHFKWRFFLTLMALWRRCVATVQGVR